MVNRQITSRSRSVNATRGGGIGLVEKQANDRHERENSYSTHGPTAEPLLPSNWPWPQILDGPPVDAVKAFPHGSSLGHA